MARLPQPGGDYGTWGDLLNEFLQVTHNTNGTLKDGSATSNTIAGSIPQSKITNLTTDLADRPTQAQADVRYIRTVNNVAPDGAGNVTVGGSGGAVDSVNGQTGTVTLNASDIGAADSSHTHTITDTTGLQAALDGKAATSHTHAQSDVTGLTTALSGKASTTHTHAIADVTNLQASLDTLTTNVGSAQTSADTALSVLSGSVMRVVMWNSGTSSWPGRPAGVPAGMVTYNSTNDAAATTPTSALTGDLWAKALS